jgi:hypothetical protein
MALKRCPLRLGFTQGNRKQSTGAKSGKYREVVKNSNTFPCMKLLYRSCDVGRSVIVQQESVTWLSLFWPNVLKLDSTGSIL